MLFRLYLLLLFIFILPFSVCGQTLQEPQDSLAEAISKVIQIPDVERHVYFLASDELMGRQTGSHYLNIAGRYIASSFHANKVQSFPGKEDYYQTIPFERIRAPERGEIVTGDTTFAIEKDFIILNSLRGSFSGPLQILDYGSEAELENRDVEGKVVVMQVGAPGQRSPQQWFAETERKNRSLMEKGAEAIIELYEGQQIPWQMLVDYLHRERFQIADNKDTAETELPHFWLNSTDADLYAQLAELESETITATVEGERSEATTSHNIIGVIEGTDPDLRNEYLLLGAHYDHIGVSEDPHAENVIYNGARDNAVGTAAILLAGRYFSQYPPKRSVILAAWTAEEIGLMGSNHFAENSPVPLEQIIFNLNIDGAGYNDTTKVTVIGLERTEAEEELKISAAAFGLEAIPDPVPEQNLFDRSDNVNFSKRGIPAPTYSLGFTAFDEEIERYYHTVKDEPQTIHYRYVTDFVRSFVLAASKIANGSETPFWREGDIYHEAGVELYGRD